MVNIKKISLSTKKFGIINKLLDIKNIKNYEKIFLN